MQLPFFFRSRGGASIKLRLVFLKKRKPWILVTHITTLFADGRISYKEEQVKLRYYDIIFIILLLREFFPPALADGFPLEFERQQISSCFLDSSSILANLNNARWSPLVFIFPIPLIFFPKLWWLYGVHRLQLELPSLLCSIVFSVPSQGPGTHLSFCFNCSFTLGSAG